MVSEGSMVVGKTTTNPRQIKANHFKNAGTVCCIGEPRMIDVQEELRWQVGCQVELSNARSCARFRLVA